jgi:hypothetical protein
VRLGHRKLSAAGTVPVEAEAPAGYQASGTAAVVSETAGAGAADAGSAQSYRFGRLGWVGVALLLMQGLAMLAWSTLLWQRFALSWDYSIEYQALWLIAHGHFDPLSTLFGTYGFPFWQLHLVLMTWLLAPLGLIVPNGPVLLWVQDLCLVGAEVVAWRWIHEVTATRLGGQGRLLAGMGLVLLLANPWAWWSISFDYHIQVVAVLFAMLAAYDLAHERHWVWVWVWVVLTILCGVVAATWVAGLGLAALLAGRRWRRQGIALVALGVTWTVLATVIHADKGGSLISTYGYLASSGVTPDLMSLVSGIAAHPTGVFAALWGHRLDIWANLAPGGLIGIASPWALGLALPILLAGNLARGNAFAQPLFQNVLLYVVVPLGTVLVLTRMHRRWPRLALGLGALVVANAVVWSVVWAAQTPVTWLRVSPAAAAVLAQADGAIPPSAEVVASQGVVGRFSGRVLVYAVMSPSQRIPLRTRDTWWVVAPAEGIETESSAAAFALVQELAGSLHARLVLHGHGVWVFHWMPPADLQSIVVPGLPQVANAWLFAGAAGTPDLIGPPSSWHLVSTGHAGYVLDQAYWLEPAGHYEASVMLASTVPVNVEVWNATGNVLLSRLTVPAATGVDTITMPVDAERIYPHHLFQGWGPFQAASTPPPAGNQLEIRVWSAGGGLVDVLQIGIQRVG